MKHWPRAIQERIAEVVYGLNAGGNPLRVDEYYDAAGNYHRSDDDYNELRPHSALGYRAPAPAARLLSAAA